ncbi:hypothetical protein NDN08_000259 [Rhodosorus marinus]|uniref:Myb-like domain-containing protein n=1 Tax=Rhodosorus marinus TaxID=101924 RepID=A0AAV8UI12_9RHOD|nr:hypothetical protein NDN08_000259 [Rhodosorus marinus]
MGRRRRVSLNEHAIDGLLAEVQGFELNGGEDFISDDFDPKALDDEGQQEIDSWPEARRKAWERRSFNLNSYSYRYTDPGETQRQGPWTDEERELFLKLLKTHSFSEGKWGIFSRSVPGRVGYQCTNVIFEKRNNRVDSDAESSVRSSDESLYAEDFFLSNACLQRIRDMKSEEFARDPERFVPGQYVSGVPIASPTDSKKSTSTEIDATPKHEPEEETYDGREDTPDGGLSEGLHPDLINKQATPTEEAPQAENHEFRGEKEPAGGEESNPVEPSLLILEDKPLIQSPGPTPRGAADLKVTWSSPLVPTTDSESVKIQGKWGNSSLIRRITPGPTTAKEATEESNKLPNSQELVAASVEGSDLKINSEGPTESSKILRSPSNSRKQEKQRTLDWIKTLPRSKRLALQTLDLSRPLEDHQEQELVHCLQKRMTELCDSGSPLDDLPACQGSDVSFITEQHLSRLIWERKVLLREFQRASSYATRKDVDHHLNWFVGLCSEIDCSPRASSAMKKHATDVVSVISQFSNELDVLVRRQAMEVHGIRGTAQILGNSPPVPVIE